MPRFASSNALYPEVAPCRTLALAYAAAYPNATARRLAIAWWRWEGAGLAAFATSGHFAGEQR